MNTPALCACMAFACTVFSGCANKSVNTPVPSGFPATASAADPRVETAHTANPQITLSAFSVSVQGKLPKAKGALAFLADENALKTGAAFLTTQQTEKALKALATQTVSIGGQSLPATFPSGMAVQMRFLSPASKTTLDNEIRIIVGGIEQDFTQPELGLQLKVRPEAQADGTVKLNIQTSLITFDGLVEYKGPSAVELPSGFQQPVFSTKTSTIDTQLPSNRVMVFKIESARKAPESESTTGLIHADSWDKNETILVFLGAHVR